MNSNAFLRVTRDRHFAAAIILLPAAMLSAQDQHDSKAPAPPHHAEEAKAASGHHYDYGDAGWVLRTYHLTSATQQNDANEILVALRNVLHPEIKIYLVASQNAILLYAPPDQQELAENIVKELDRLKPTYRVKYTLSEIDNGKRAGVQHYSMTIFDGQRAVLKEGSKIPVITGSSSPDEKSSAIYQYLDIGMNFDLTASRAGNTVTLKNKVEQSSVAEHKSLVAGVEEPVVRQAIYEGVFSVQLGKPMIIGTMDIPDSSRRIEIEVLIEPSS